jgi:hypothetical protein
MRSCARAVHRRALARFGALRSGWGEEHVPVRALVLALGKSAIVGCGWLRAWGGVVSLGLQRRDEGRVARAFCIPPMDIACKIEIL